MKFIQKYIPLFFLLALSGNPLFTDMEYSKILLPVYTVLFGVYCLSTISYKTILSNINKLVLVASILLILSLLQYLKFGLISLPGVIAFIIKITLAWFTYLYYIEKRIHFFNLYIKMLSVLSILSIPFWLLNQFSSWGIQLANPFLKSTFFYTMFPVGSNETTILIRNSGMFWEPGAFAGYIILALIFIVIINKSFSFKNFKTEFLILSTALITTQSTTGYLLYGILIIMHFALQYSFLRIIVLPVLFILVSTIYVQVEFLQNKIVSQYESALELDRREISNTRMGSLVMDWQYIISSPLFGNSLHENNRWRFHPWVKEDIGHGNGMSNFIVWWGIPFFIFWLYCLYKHIERIVKNHLISIILIFMFILMLQGEQFLNFPMFLLFFLVPFKHVVLKKRVLKTTM